MLAMPDAAGHPLSEVLALRDQDGGDWYSNNRPYDGLRTRVGDPRAVLDPAQRHRGAGHRPDAAQPPAAGPVERVAVLLRSGRGRARLDRERSDLVATVAHELRSPLTGVKGFVQALLNRWDKLNDEQKKLMLTTVHSDSERLSRLIAELLDVARIDTGRLSLFPRHSDAARPGRPGGGQRPGRHRPQDRVRRRGRAARDLRRPRQVHPGGHQPGRERRHPRRGRRPGDRDRDGRRADEFPGVRVVVEDEGEGIAPEMRRRVFTKFWTSGVARRLRARASTSSTGWSAPTAARS